MDEQKSATEEQIAATSTLAEPAEELLVDLEVSDGAGDDVVGGVGVYNDNGWKW